MEKAPGRRRKRGNGGERTRRGGMGPHNFNNVVAPLLTGHSFIKVTWISENHEYLIYDAGYTDV